MSISERPPLAGEFATHWRSVKVARTIFSSAPEAERGQLWRTMEEGKQAMQQLARDKDVLNYFMRYVGLVNTAIQALEMLKLPGHATGILTPEAFQSKMGILSEFKTKEDYRIGEDIARNPTFFMATEPKKQHSQELKNLVIFRPDGSQIRGQSAAVYGVLKSLINRGEAVSYDQIAIEVYGENPSASNRQTLTALIGNIAKMLEVDEGTVMRKVQLPRKPGLNGKTKKGGTPVGILLERIKDQEATS